MRLFADNSKVYRIIYDENDEKQFQCDLNTLQKWSENRQLRGFILINVRFYILPMREILLAIYTSYLAVRFSLSPKRLIWGVSLTSNLSRNTQTQTVLNKANKIVGILKRNVGLGNKEVFSRLYKALVIPILEYAVPLSLTPLKEFNVGPRNTLFRCGV